MNFIIMVSLCVIVLGMSVLCAPKCSSVNECKGYSMGTLLCGKEPRYLYVCGKDGVTYGNACLAACNDVLVDMNDGCDESFCFRTSGASIASHLLSKGLPKSFPIERRRGKY